MSWMSIYASACFHAAVDAFKSLFSTTATEVNLFAIFFIRHSTSRNPTHPQTLNLIQIYLYLLCEFDFLLKNLRMDSTQPSWWRLVFWIHICASLNHRIAKKAELSRHDPSKACSKPGDFKCC